MFRRMILSACVLMGIGANGLTADLLDDVQYYVGGAGGVSALSGQYRALNASAGNTHYSRSGGTHLLIGGVAGAQTTLCDDYYAALQFNALYNNLDKNLRSDTNAAGALNNVVSLRNNFQWGLDARFGMETMCGATPYLLGGFEIGKFNLQLSNPSGVSERGILGGSTLNHKKSLVGGKFGVGVNVPICCQWVANLEYSYTWFGNVQTTLVDSVTGLTWNHKTEVRQNSVLLGLNYLF